MKTRLFQIALLGLLLSAPSPSGSLLAQSQAVQQGAGAPKLTPARFTFKLRELHPGIKREDGNFTVGYIDVFKHPKNKPQPGSLHQSIDVVMTENESYFAQFGTRRPDLNCDGFPDLEIFEHGGAKWGRSHIWLYDPLTETFVTSPLTRQFATMSYATYTIHTNTAHLDLRRFHGATISNYTYRITPERLILESSHLVEE